MDFLSSVCFYDIFVHSVGVMGIIASIISFQCKKHKNMLIFRTANEMLFAVQYFLLGAYTGMAMNLIGSLRNVFFTRMVEKKKNTYPVRILFSIAFAVFTLLTWEGYKSLLSGSAKIISTFAYGSSNTSLVRIIILITSTGWFLYNICVKSYAGCACELFTICSIIFAIVRIDILKK